MFAKALIFFFIIISDNNLNSIQADFFLIFRGKVQSSRVLLCGSFNILVFLITYVCGYVRVILCYDQN